jgi:hypothetical protein
MHLSASTLAILGGIALFVAYLTLVLRDSKGDFVAPRLPARPQKVGFGEAKTSTRQPSGGSHFALPEIRPPEGTLAAGTRSHRVPSSGASDPDVEAAGLLRILRSASDLQRQAAAKALSLPFSGTCNPEVAEALAQLVADEDAQSSLRAEAWIALRVVMGEELAWEQEVEARHNFPEGLDSAWLSQILVINS